MTAEEILLKHYEILSSKGGHTAKDEVDSALAAMKEYAEAKWNEANRMLIDEVKNRLSISSDIFPSQSDKIIQMFEEGKPEFKP